MKQPTYHVQIPVIDIEHYRAGVKAAPSSSSEDRDIDQKHAEDARALADFMWHCVPSGYSDAVIMALIDNYIRAGSEADILAHLSVKLLPYLPDSV